MDGAATLAALALRQQHQYSVHNAQTENSLSEILELCAHPHSTPNTMPSWLERRWPGLHIAFKTNFLTPDDAVECSFGSYLSSSIPEASVNTVNGNGFPEISHLSISDHSKQLLKQIKFVKTFDSFQRRVTVLEFHLWNDSRNKNWNENFEEWGEC